VPITDDIVAMPLIGQLDERRMERVMAALLDGVAAKGTRFAILDVTGVPFVDAAVARSLVGVARAVQLLGARVILTGIRPDVARTLAQMDTDLGGIVTRSTLKDGIAFAMGPRTLGRQR
jgi:anti-anti-sigma factor